MKMLIYQQLLILIVFVIAVQIPHNGVIVNACTSFYCINSCGGYKLILANNRDEDIYRPTLPATVWPDKSAPKSTNFFKNDQGSIFCDQSQSPQPFNLCVYGAIDTLRGIPPNRYSTWLAINERGDLGNILFFMGGKTGESVGTVVSDYLLDSSWPNVDAYMRNLTSRRSTYRSFNFVQAAISPTTGNYSLYYVNNNDTTVDYVKLNDNENDAFYFGISNSDPTRPFRKVGMGLDMLKNIVSEFKINSDKKQLVDRLLYQLIQNTTENYPDENLAAFMNAKDNPEITRNVSKINADYGSFWKNSHTRTSTVILVDYDNNVEYHELNLTSWQNETDYNIRDKEWVMNSFKFKLKPLSTQTTSTNTPTTTSYNAGSVMRGLAGFPMISALFLSFFMKFVY